MLTRRAGGGVQTGVQQRSMCANLFLGRQRRIYDACANVNGAVVESRRPSNVGVASTSALVVVPLMLRSIITHEHIGKDMHRTNWIT